MNPNRPNRPGEPMQHKSTVDEIRARFDQDVERFSNLETGQAATIDAPTALQLIALAAHAATPHAAHVLDVGCGAGNFSLRLLSVSPARQLTLVDLSRPMLDRAVERIREAHGIQPRTMHGDLRELPLEPEQYDIVLAGAVLHHLRDDAQWEATFQKLYACLRPGGSLWIFDLVTASSPAIQELQQQRYGQYLTALRDTSYRDLVFDYIEREDTPRSLVYQLDLLKQVGFDDVDVLHFHTCFAAFGGLKSIERA